MRSTAPLSACGAIVAGTLAILLAAVPSRVRAAQPGPGDPADLGLAAQIKTWRGPARDYPRGIRLEEDLLVRPRRGEDGRPLYAVEVPPGGEANIGLEWAEQRAIDRVVVEYVDRRAMPGFGDQDLQLWVKAGGEAGAPEGGRTPAEGAWRSTRDAIRVEGTRWTHTFPPPRHGVLKVRLVVHGVGRIAIRSFEAYGRAHWRAARVRFRWGVGRRERRDWDGRIEVFNGIVREVVPLGEGPDAPRVEGATWRSIAGAGTEPALEARILATDAEPDSPDRTIVTFRSRVRSFSFLLADLERDGLLGVRDFGVVVARGDLEPTAAALASRLEGRPKTIRARVAERPEQSYASALASIPAKRRTKFLVLSPPLARNKFCVRPDGSFSPRWDRNLTYAIEIGGGPAASDPRQAVEGGYLPILTSAWEDGAIRWRAAYLARLQGDAPAVVRGDEPTVLLVRLEAENAGDAPAVAKARIRLRRDKGPVGGLRFEDGFLFQGTALRLRVDAPSKGKVAFEEDAGIAYAAELASGGKASLVLKAPWPPDGADPTAAKAALAALDFDASHASVRSQWEAILARGMDLRVPEAPLDRIWRSLLIHQYAWGDRDPETGHDRANVAAVVYGPVGNESSQMAKALDLYGHHEQARRYLEPLWRMQGSDELRACVSDGRGALYGFWPHYVFNTGFILWNGGIHWKLTRDRAWLDQALPNFIEACDWIARQRRLTMRDPAPGPARLEYGFFPACGLEDEPRYRYWTMTNGYMYAGMRTVADVLAEIGHPDANRIAHQARAFREDLLRGIRESTVRAPVVRLRDGWYVPYVPKHLYRRGRSEGHYEAELGALHLASCDLVAPRDEMIDWILDVHEDIVYMTEAPDHRSIVPLEEIEKRWFSLGGFAKTQPYLLHNPIVHLRRDDVKGYLRGLWNTLVAMNYRDINAFPEHFCWSGAADCKTYEEAMFLQEYRAMFVHEEGGELWLAKGTPRHWLAEGGEIEVRRAPSFFGPLSYRIRSEAAKGRIVAHVDGPRRNPPAKLILRLRHPEPRPMRAVTVNGEPWSAFEPAAETIHLPVRMASLDVVATY